VGGWLIALVAWLVSASHSTFGQLALIGFFTFIAGAGYFVHAIAGSSEVLAAVLTEGLPVSHFLRWLAMAVLGNAVGGVGLVSLLNYGQVETTRPAPPALVTAPGGAGPGVGAALDPRASNWSDCWTSW